MVSRHPLAGRAIARMNGAGNKILVLDLRGAAVRPAPADARAIHRAPRLDYDQMMVIGDPRTPGTAADVMIYNNDGTLAGACGNGSRCVADRLCRGFGLDAVTIETTARQVRHGGRPQRGQNAGEPQHVKEFLSVALFAPLLVVAVLGPAPAVHAGGLDVPQRVRRDPDVLPGRWDRQRTDALQYLPLRDLCARRVAVPETFAAPFAGDSRA